MKRFLDFVWPVIGLIVVGVSLWLLHEEFRGEAVGAHVWANLKATAFRQYALAATATLIAYAALAWYDRIALLHLGVKHISWLFITLCSFTTYALGHNIGASVFSGAMVRYRAYSSKGLSAAQIVVLVGVCSLTFGLGTLLLSGLVLTITPEQLQRLNGFLPAYLTDPTIARLIGILCLGIAAAYAAGSVLRLRPLVIGGFRIEYPRPAITVRQFLAASMELLGAAGIIYFALPETGNPGYFFVLGVFLASFSAALVSHAPGGLGIFELLFVHAMPDVNSLDVLTALVVFRLLYLILPLLFALVVVVLFERRKLAEVLHHAKAEPAGEADGALAAAQLRKSAKG
ncbi:MAG: lysylphosphatidylglycerol synthase transmembrane domain-containing protein [Beijerinckiaceae bacterium]